VVTAPSVLRGLSDHFVWENQAIVGFHLKNPLEGYWETFLMSFREDSGLLTSVRIDEPR
jgi:hypothetical protein